MPISGAGMFPAALAGLGRASERAARAAADIASGHLDPRPIVDLKLAETDFKANARVLAAADEMERSLLDILA